MRLLPRLFAALALLLLSLGPVLAREDIRAMLVDIEVNTDGSVDVTETITVNAEGMDIRRGIYRDIPVTMRGEHGNTIRLDLKVHNVARDGADEPFRVERMGDFRRIWIGDPDAFVSRGLHRYTLTYTLPRMIRPSANGDELYWNATGNYWIFPVLEAVARVKLPAGATAEDAVGYTGPVGSIERAVSIARKGANQVSFTATRTLGPGEGMTIALSFPKGFVTYPQGSQALLQSLSDNRETLLSIGAVLLLLLYNFTAWLRVGRDPKKGTIIPLFHPPKDFSPALTHYVHNWGFKGSGWNAMTAAIFNLGVKGLVTIDNAKKTLTVTATSRAPAEKLPIGEQILFDYFSRQGAVTFDQTTGPELNEKRAAFVNAITLENRQKWFNANFGFAAVSYVLTALLLAAMAFFEIIEIEWLVLAGVLGIFASAIGSAMFSVIIKGHWLGRIILIVWVSLFVANAGLGILDMVISIPINTSFVAAASMVMISLVFTVLLRAPTVQGRKVMDEIEGLKLYLETAEQNRLNIVDEPPLTVERFERILPYAIALGVEKPWSAHFEAELARNAPSDQPISTYAPAWYSGGRDFSTNRIANTISAASAGMASAMIAAQPVQASSSGSSGGGFSGGGGGGGGGGGW